MSLLDRLLGRRPDPTLGWGRLRLPLPDFDFTKMQFGLLEFGDAIEAAAFLGRPDCFEWTQSAYCELLYAAAGFQIDFDDGKLAYLAFFIGPDHCMPAHEKLAFSRPRLRGCVPDDVRLSRDTDLAQLERLFGKAESVDAEPKETILYYSRAAVMMEFEMDGKSRRLKRWNLYPK